MKKLLVSLNLNSLDKAVLKSIKGAQYDSLPGEEGEGEKSVTCKNADQNVIGYTTTTYCVDALCQCNAVYGSVAQYAVCY